MSEDIYDRIETSFRLSPELRFKVFQNLHAVIVPQYTAALRRLDAGQVEIICPDGRTLKQLVGHIGEWDRFLLLAAGEILAGVKDPQIMRDRGYLLPNGNELQFTGVDNFNDLIATWQTAAAWDEIRRTAIRSAELLQRLFAYVMTVDLLEATVAYRWQITSERTVDTTAGWFLWGILLEHESVAHAKELGL
jgi:hypothetical protein